MSREKLIEAKKQMESCGWVSQQTLPQRFADGPKMYGLKMVHGADIFWLNLETVDNVPKGTPVQKMDSFKIMDEFNKAYPWIRHGCLSLHKMKQILDGDLIPVRLSGKRKFQLWKKEDIESGKLDKLNAQIRAHNRMIRQGQRDYNRRFEALINQLGVDGALKKLLDEML